MCFICCDTTRMTENAFLVFTHTHTQVCCMEKCTSSVHKWPLSAAFIFIPDLMLSGSMGGKKGNIHFKSS